MTVYIEKPAVNLREELADLRNQGTYQEQQFWYENAVTNGTFNSDTSGWTAQAGDTISVDTQRLKVEDTNSAGAGVAYQTISTVIGKTYVVKYSSELGTATQTRVYAGTTATNANLGLATDSVDNPSGTFTFVATATTTYISLVTQTTGAHSFFDNISVYETDGTDVIHRLPKGWKPKDVFEDGLLQREGAAHDYEVVYDGFDYFVKPTVAPSATTQTCVIGVKA